MKNGIQEIFDRNKGVVSTKTLLAHGINHYQINHLIENGWVVKLKHGIYKWQSEEINEWEDVKNLVPHGVVCLYTAALHYELTTFVPSAYHVAIPKKAKVVLPDYPPIQLYYWDTTSFDLGICPVMIQETSVSMYDMEKTVCDIVRLRNKIGMDTTKEVVKNYLNRSDRNVAKLNEYAQKLNISTVLSNFLNILL